ncbi:MAG: glycosyltransferase [Candidatus Curtissbacteria bacterium]|nr:glycosyltransferase [Candidatus Curtissbacteria bacterium]
MAKVSIIIPSCGEKDINIFRTLKSIYENATGECEVIVGLNGEPFNDIPKDLFPNLKIIRFPVNVGIKTNINSLAALATGKYIYKSDAHCAFGKGFDEILQADMQDDWVVTPRFYVLNGETWEWQDDRFYDYFYLSCPFTDKRGLRFKAGGHWPERTEERKFGNGKFGIVNTKEGIDSFFIDETPQIHGSGWFMTKDRFFELGGFPITDPYGHGQEPLWIALKNWVEGGKVMVNKKTWYAHLHQDSKDRGYPEDKVATERTYNLTAEYWLKHPKFEWFVDKFMPMPTWDPDWREKLQEWREQNG